jgi:hypothetical protein
MSNRSGTYDRVAGPGRNDVRETCRGDAALLSFRNNREGHVITVISAQIAGSSTGQAVMYLRPSLVARKIGRAANH